jgi:hypothetical protein
VLQIQDLRDFRHLRRGTTALSEVNVCSLLRFRCATSASWPDEGFHVILVTPFMCDLGHLAVTAGAP